MEHDSTLLQSLTLQVAHYADLAEEKEQEIIRLDAALRKIAAGKMPEDGGMDIVTASRLCGIARDALRPDSASEPIK